MPNDDWVEDVRRWYFGGNPPAADRAGDEMGDDAMGYEAAQPALIARRRNDAPQAPHERPA